MKLEYVKLVNYAGLKRGSGLTVMEVDFTKQKHQLCLIIGKNKSGKTTFNSALHPFPDNNSCFVSREPGQKVLRYMTDMGPILIDITHPVTKNGDRGITKASCKRLDENGNWIELNPNGNIGSYKELIESIFGLDPSFLALTCLSSEDRGIVDKRPGDRKKYITSILDNMETYNNIGRSMTKRVNSLKAMVNSLTTKIDAIGTEDDLNLKLGAINAKIAALEESKDTLLVKKTQYTTMVDNIDPDKSILDVYNRDMEELSSITITLEKELKTLEDVLHTSSISEAKKIVSSMIVKVSKDKDDIEKELISIRSVLPDLLASHEEQVRSIELKNARLMSLQSENDYSTLKKNYKMIQEQIKSCEELFVQMKVTNPESISKDEYILALNTLKDIKENISCITQERTIVLSALNSVIGSSDLINDLNNAKSEYDKLSLERQDLLADVIRYEFDVDKIKVLDNRPKNCSIDSCPFISEAISISKTNPVDRLDKAQSRINEINSRMSELNVIMNNIEMIMTCATYLRNIKRDIDNNKNLLLKLPHGNLFVDISYIVDSVLNGDDFSVMDDIYQTIVNANIFDTYRMMKQREIELSSELKIFASKNEIVVELQKDIADLRESTDKTMSRIIELQNDTQTKEALLVQSDTDLNNWTMLSVICEEIEKYNNRKIELEQELDRINENTSKLKEYITQVNICQDKINNITKELQLVRQDKDQIAYSVQMLIKYKEELEVYKKKFWISNIIRKHSVPQTGIQIMFMKIFMGQTIRITNELLMNFFNGDIQLDEEYVIDENEFRLPCYDIPSGIVNDDISNCSTSEKCMLGMLIGYALLRQSSTEYDILKLDEIDSGLDAANRMQFLNKLHEILNILGISQCIMISHSSEADLSNVDIIQLATPDIQMNNVNGNVIFHL